MEKRIKTMSEKVLPKRLEYLDSLRGLAAYAVVAGHFFPDSWVKRLPIINLVTDTKLAVCLFFILSGVVLTKQNYIKNINIWWIPIQVAARLIRLAIPVFFVALFVWFLVYSNLLFNGRLPNGYEFWEAYIGLINGEIDLMRVIYFSFIETFFLYDNKTTLITPAWTMRPEFIGSILVFIYAYLNHKGVIRNIPYLLILVSIICVFTYKYLPALFYCGFFLTGVALKKISEDNLTWLKYPLLSLISILIIKTILELFDIDSFELDYIFASLIIFFLMHAKSIHEVMSWRPFLWLARISFVLYLLHVPLIASFGLNLLCYFGENGVDVRVAQLIVFVFLSLLLFIISRIFLPVETLAINLSRKIRSLY